MKHTQQRGNTRARKPVSSSLLTNTSPGVHPKCMLSSLIGVYQHFHASVHIPRYSNTSISHTSPVCMVVIFSAPTKNCTCNCCGVEDLQPPCSCAAKCCYITSLQPFIMKVAVMKSFHKLEDTLKRTKSSNFVIGRL